MPSPALTTAHALIAAFNAMDIPRIISLRAPSCTHQILPRSIRQPQESNAAYEARLRFILPAFHNFSLAVQDTLEDVAARKVCMWLYARADSRAGEYCNEYVWMMDFDEGGRLLAVREYVDTAMQRDFFPRLRESLRGEGKEREGGEGEEREGRPVEGKQEEEEK
ncbi:hypothetical protein MMC13_007537 [Lambiella insularis]|nr:hypothetical protein [Lambiella insularis]